MVKNSLTRLEYLCEVIPPLLLVIPEAELSHKPSASKWSKKEVLGHLVDSASNNHQRFVRVQFEETPYISYDPDLWNNHGYYNSLDTKALISFWKFYNKHLAALAGHIPETAYSRSCKVGEHSVVSLEFLIKDYVEHMEHHLKQIVNYT